MKKFLACTLVLCLMLSVCACSKAAPDETGEKHSDTTAVDSQKPEETKKPDMGGSITLQDVMNHPVTPVEDFKYGLDDENGGIAIYGYEGDDEIVVLPDTIDDKPVTLVEKFTFGSGSIVKGIRISDNVKVVDQGAFGLNENLEVAVCGSGLVKIGEAAFMDCTNLHTLNLNDGLTRIENLAFSGCHAIKELEIPDSVTELINSPFFGLGEDFTVIGKAGSVVEEVAIGNRVSFRAK